MESSVGARLREERMRIGLSQVDFGALASVTKTTQGNYEANKRSPDAVYLNAVSSAGVDIQYIVTGNRSTGAGVPLDAVKQAVEKAFTMVSASKMAVSPSQLAAMVTAFLPETAAAYAKGSAESQPSPGMQVQGHGNMVATGHGISQVGGQQRILRKRKMQSN